MIQPNHERFDTDPKTADKVPDMSAYKAALPWVGNRRIPAEVTAKHQPN
jgi:hypothetical protein